MKTSEGDREGARGEINDDDTRSPKFITRK